MTHPIGLRLNLTARGGHQALLKNKTPTSCSKLKRLFKKLMHNLTGAI